MFELALPTVTLSLEHPVVMGIVNVTPDSFSDGGQFLDHRHAIDHGLGRGVILGYVERDDELAVVRGRMRYREQVTRRS